jgi:hypothetical protein
VSPEEASAYERDQSQRTKVALAKLDRMIPGLLELASRFQAPAVRLLCPRCHDSLGPPLRLEETTNNGPMLVFLPGEAPLRGTTTAKAMPSAYPNLRGLVVCATPGCPTRTRTAYCSAHGGREFWAVDHVKTRFTCGGVRAGRPCGWSQEVTNARLLEVYGGAVMRRQGEVLATGKLAACRRPDCKRHAVA